MKKNKVMKKNKMMRLASGLLVAVLLTTCAISGTFAKYVTSDSGSDSARVAKWGVTAVVSGDLFGADYANATDGNKISATYTGSVDSSKDANGDKIVAPGTTSDAGVTISISGTPEVANKVTFASTAADNKDIFLAAGSYGTMVAVTGITADNFAAGTYYTESSGTYTKAATYAADTAYYALHDAATVTDNPYYPIKWRVKAGDNTTEYTSVAAMVTALETTFSTTTDNKSLEAIDKSCTIFWEWAFEGQNDGADTILGNIIAADSKAVPVKAEGDTYKTLTDGTDYCTTVAFNYSITVTQID